MQETLDQQKLRVTRIDDLGIVSDGDNTYYFQFGVHGGNYKKDSKIPPNLDAIALEYAGSTDKLLNDHETIKWFLQNQNNQTEMLNYALQQRISLYKLDAETSLLMRLSPIAEGLFPLLVRGTFGSLIYHLTGKEMKATTSAIPLKVNEENDRIQIELTKTGEKNLLRRTFLKLLMIPFLSSMFLRTSMAGAAISADITNSGENLADNLVRINQKIHWVSSLTVVARNLIIAKKLKYMTREKYYKNILHTLGHGHVTILDVMKLSEREIMKELQKLLPLFRAGAFPKLTDLYMLYELEFDLINNSSNVAEALVDPDLKKFADQI